jgi:pimeloyl-ACP methyl ester carboxylesterase
MIKIRTRKKLVIDKTKIAYFQTGNEKSPKLLLIHGIMANSSFFYETIASLEKHFNILTLDLPGFGLSPPFKNRRHSIENYSDLIQKFCHYKNFDDYHLLGSSFGSLIALDIYDKKTKSIKKMVLHAPPIDKSFVNQQLIEKFLLFLTKYDKVINIANSAKSLIKEKLFRQAVKLLNPHYYGINQRNGIIYYTFKTMNLNAAKEILEIIMTNNSLLKIKKIHTETLIISGDHDVQVKPERVSELTNYSDNIQLKILKDLTHAIFLDKPKYCASIVKDFILNKN